MNGLTPYPITPIGNFIGVILALLPLISQIRKLTLAVWGSAIWIAVVCFQNFVNTIIWHNNINIVAPVWCDIATKFQIGAGVGTRACALIICLQLYKITRARASVEIAKDQRRKTMIYELLLIIGFPFLVMALYIIVQPTRFNIVEEAGCGTTDYSYVAYIVVYGPPFMFSLGSTILAPLTLRTFLRHRKEMNELLSSGQDATHNKYTRLMVIACLDTICLLPVDITIIVMSILEGKENSLNYPYVSWKNVHDGEGGNAPNISLSSIEQVPANEWSTFKWDVFIVKWNEWLYVLHAVMFFCVFGTTPEMRRLYRSVFWFIPERLGYKKRHVVSEVETVSDVEFNSNPGQQLGDRPAAGKRRDSLSFRTTIDTSTTYSKGMIESNINDLEYGMTTTDTNCTGSTVIFAAGDKSQGEGGL